MDTRLHDSPTAELPFDAALAFELLPDAYLILNRRYQILLANAHYLAFTGQALGDLLGKSLFDVNQFGAVEQREARRDWLLGALNGLSTGHSVWSPLFRYEMPEPQTHRDDSAEPAEPGMPRYWKIKASLLGASEGQGGYIALRVSEVTDRVSELERDQRERAKLRSQAQLRLLLADEAKAQLREHQERFQLALAFSQLGAWELDPTTGVFECTDQCKTNLGLGQTSVLTERRLYGELVHPEDRIRLRDAIGHAHIAPEHVEVDFRIGWASGSIRWILVRGVGRFAADGSLSSVIGFTLDITARKEAELEQREIAASEKRAREHSERLTMAMDHFVTTVSHELRSPLSAIMSWTDLLQRAADPAHIGRATGVISRNARQLSHMVDDLLDSGAIVTGKLSVHLEPVDLGALAGIIAEDMRMHAEAKGLRLVATDLASVTVLADEGRMKQVIWNLVSNAVKFSPQGTVELSVRVIGDRVCDRVELAVRDTGLGLDEESLERIFERFQQFSADGSGRVAGLGLGLWLVKNLVELHGGTIAAESPGMGQGATFRVSLPIAR
ncbi:ATP-binding protein [Paraburkholderia sp. BCC1886]|uniref:sensor histidine kinase n=1 Tax=Paraburkholderia sp. BCC1886 TaxID=2562670 RepID=UPI0011835A1D|nr:ATP-binding protein [Paraburkholderia sp. BCC1886]